MKLSRIAIAFFLAGSLLLLCCACGPGPEAPEVPPQSAQQSGAPEDSLPPEEAPPPAEEPEPPAPEPADDDFVRVQDYIPDIRVELKYATADNFTGTVIYGFSDAYLRYGTVKKLAAAQETAASDGYSLLIWDAFRPTAAQYKLWEICPDPVYVANPNNGFSSHSRGNTVDVTLVYSDGSAVEVPTGFDDFSPLADRDYSDVPSAAAAEHARYLETVMEDCGFQPYSGEWWHFSDTDSYEVEETFLSDQV